MAWDSVSESIPASSASPSSEGVSGTLVTNWANIETNFGALRHYTFTSAASGEHKQGLMGGVYKGTTAQIAALSSPGSGALALSTNDCVMKVYDNSSWKDINSEYYPRMYKTYREAALLVPASTLTTIPLSASGYELGNFDTLSEYSTSTYRYTVLNSGYYLCTCSVQVGNSTLTAGLPIQLFIYVNGLVASTSVSKYSKLTGRVLFVADVITLTTGDYVTFVMYHIESTVLYINPAAVIVRLS